MRGDRIVVEESAATHHDIPQSAFLGRLQRVVGIPREPASFHMQIPSFVSVAHVHGKSRSLTRRDVTGVSVRPAFGHEVDSCQHQVRERFAADLQGRSRSGAHQRRRALLSVGSDQERFGFRRAAAPVQRSAQGVASPKQDPVGHCRAGRGVGGIEGPERLHRVGCAEWIGNLLGRIRSSRLVVSSGSAHEHDPRGVGGPEDGPARRVPGSRGMGRDGGFRQQGGHEQTTRALAPRRSGDGLVLHGNLL